MPTNRRNEMAKHNLCLWTNKNGYNFVVIQAETHRDYGRTEKAILSGLIRAYCFYKEMNEYEQDCLFSAIRQFVLLGRDLTPEMLYEMMVMSVKREIRFSWQLPERATEYVKERPQYGKTKQKVRRKHNVIELLGLPSIQKHSLTHLGYVVTFGDIQQTTINKELQYKKAVRRIMNKTK